MSQNNINSDENLGEPARINHECDHEINEKEFRLTQVSFQFAFKKWILLINILLFQEVLEKYHNEMKESLKKLNDKIDNCTKAVEDLSDLTKKIPQWLIKLKNEKVPRVFVMIPDQKDWKKPAYVIY
ncbi:hypothetical protein C1645_550283 [Glomus cerebriforme]|uniref:Uncharacterized protein n=1 Tax=Glomus cerebriforme TaxID=658196 RepID=A0A397S5D2_9GLOM|nr:hypothetical protein C1645_550283 [Glomus cerebriforme]